MNRVPDYDDIRTIVGNRFSITPLERRNRIHIQRLYGGTTEMTVSLALPDLSSLDRGVLEGIGADLRGQCLRVQDYHFAWMGGRVDVVFEMTSLIEKEKRIESQPKAKGSFILKAKRPSILRRLFKKIHPT